MRIRSLPYLRYVVAVLCVGLATAALMVPTVGRGFASVFFLAVLVSAWYGGLGPGLAATGLAAAAAVVLLVYVFHATFPAWRWVGLVMFVAGGVVITLLVEALHAARRRAEEARQLFEATLSSIGEAVVSADSEGRILFMNDVAQRLTGWGQEEAQGRMLDDVLTILSDDARESIRLADLRSRETDSVRRFGHQAILVARDGTRRPIDDCAAPIRDERGDRYGTILVFRDVSDRRKAEESTHLLAAIVESSDDAIVSKSLDGTIRSWNSGAERLFGYTADEAIGRSITLIIPPDRLDEERAILERIARGERLEHFETVRRTRQGRLLDVSLTISPLHDDAGKVIGASTIARDITERKAIEQALREADERKNQFLALLAHELRNPLAPLRNAVEILRRSVDDPALVRKARDIMDRQLGHMVRLIDDLLDVSRINRHKLELRCDRIRLDEVINSAVETAQPLIDDRRHTLTVSYPDQPVILVADFTRLAQVFANLLTNSAKYTEPGGAIRLAAERHEDEVVVTISDNGIGIPSDALPSIFDMFAQADQNFESSSGGLGIGLSLVKGLVDMHGGTVTAESAGPGQGSTFTVRLPRVRDTEIGDRAEPVPSADEPAHRLFCRGHRILVVDDNADSAASLAGLLQLMGGDVRTANDGIEAVAAADAFQPDVVLMDVDMPHLDGYEAARRIRERPWAHATRIIALTGWSKPEDPARSAAVGCDGHLVKPVDMAQLEAFFSRFFAPAEAPTDSRAASA